MNEFFTDESPQRLFDMMGNDSHLWLTSAEALLTASDVLRGQFSEVPGKEDFEDFWEFFKFHIVAQMLRGMAIEDLFKAIWIAKVGPLATNGKIKAIPDTKDHDLLSMASALSNYINLGLSEEEKNLLPVLSFAITSGRYPVSKAFNKRPSKPNSVRRMKWCKWEIPSDDEILENLLRKLHFILEEHLIKESSYE
ncbi:MAG: hypothetical protein WAV28_13225 [Sedimentisphaerales bacterium]